MVYVSPYARWPKGPTRSQSYFPVGVFLQPTSGGRAAAWKTLGANFYWQFFGDPLSSDLANLAAQGMGFFAPQDAATLALLADPNAAVITGWAGPDEPDNAANITGSPVRSTPQDLRLLADSYRANDSSRPAAISYGERLGNPLWFGNGPQYPGLDAYAGQAMPCWDINVCSIFPLTNLGVLPSFTTLVDGRPYMYELATSVTNGAYYSGNRPFWSQIECTHTNNPGAFVTGTVATTPGSGGSLTAATYYYRVTGISIWGESAGSAEATVAVGAGGKVTLNWTAIAGATGGYKVYRGTAPGGEVFLASSATNSFLDDGTITPGTTPYPTAENSRALPSYQQMRSQCWMNVIHQKPGNAGVIWFMHDFDYTGNFVTDAALLQGVVTSGPSTGNWPAQLANVTSITAELLAMASVINTPCQLSGVSVSSSDGGTPIDLTTRWVGRTAYIFAQTMRFTANVTGTFTVPGLKAGTVITVLNENRTITAGTNGFADLFATGYDTHLYSFSLGGSRLRLAYAA